MFGRRERWGVIVLGALLLSAGCGRERDASSGTPEEASGQQVPPLDPRLVQNLPPGVTADMVREGQELFLVCATCHGLDGSGTQLGPSLRDAEWIGISGTLEEIQQVIRVGVAEPEEFPVPMPELGGGRFTDAQVRALAAYVLAISRDRAAPPSAGAQRDSAR